MSGTVIQQSVLPRKKKNEKLSWTCRIHRRREGNGTLREYQIASRKAVAEGIYYQWYGEKVFKAWKVQKLRKGKVWGKSTWKQWIMIFTYKYPQQLQLGICWGWVSKGGHQGGKRELRLSDKVPRREEFQLQSCCSTELKPSRISISVWKKKNLYF